MVVNKVVNLILWDKEDLDGIVYSIKIILTKKYKNIIKIHRKKK